MSSFNNSVVLVNYFCHKCEKEFHLLFKDNTCPHCHSDFIEELANGDTLGLTGAEGGEALDGVHVDADQCSICLDDIKSPRKVLKCKHIYHKKCINDWLHIRNSCPICRKAVDLSPVLAPNFQQLDTNAEAFWRSILDSFEDLFSVDTSAALPEPSMLTNERHRRMNEHYLRRRQRRLNAAAIATTSAATGAHPLN